MAGSRKALRYCMKGRGHGRHGVQSQTLGGERARHWALVERGHGMVLKRKGAFRLPGAWQCRREGDNSWSFGGMHGMQAGNTGLSRARRGEEGAWVHV